MGYTFDQAGGVVVDPPVPPLAESAEIVQAEAHPVVPVLLLFAVQFQLTFAKGTLGAPAGESGVHITHMVN